MLTDTGSLVAIVDKNDVHHVVCTAFYRTLRAPVITTWPCLTEAAHLLRKTGGWPYVVKLWTLFDLGVLCLHVAGEAEWQRVRDLMTTYRDIPCDLADASLVAAETLGRQEVFTRDEHFYVYRRQDGSAFASAPDLSPRCYAC